MKKNKVYIYILLLVFIGIQHSFGQCTVSFSSSYINTRADIDHFQSDFDSSLESITESFNFYLSGSCTANTIAYVVDQDGERLESDEYPAWLLSVDISIDDREVIYKVLPNFTGDSFYDALYIKFENDSGHIGTLRGDWNYEPDDDYPRWYKDQDGDGLGDPYDYRSSSASGYVRNMLDRCPDTYGTSATRGCAGSEYTYDFSFENGFDDWSPVAGNDFDWTRKSGSTGSSGTGPSSANEGSYYIYTEASGSNYGSKTASIQSIAYKIGVNGMFTFDHHMYGSDMGSLTLYASSDNGSTWSNLWSLSGNQGNSWKTSEVDLWNYYNKEVLFKFTGITGSSYRGDMSIDHIQLTSEKISETATSLSKENYVYTITPTQATTDVFSLENDQKIESVTYYDGLGREKQSIAIRAGGAKEDIVSHISYDSYGRSSKGFLPFSIAENKGGFIGAGETETLAYYNANFSDELVGGTSSNPYSEKHFESSPLNRVLEQAAPGEAWALDKDSDLDHTIKFEYGTNTNLDAVRLYEVDLGGDLTYLSAETGNKSPFYALNSLYKTITKDENWDSGKNNTTEEFKNKQGQVVLKRTYADVDLNADGTLVTSEQEIAHDTYYVYDLYGNLTFVLPPLVDTSDGISDSELKELCYQYRYDSRNRLVEKKIPGKDWEYIVYDALDRPVLTQDANLRVENKWLFTKYDVFGRVVYTGVYTHSDKKSQLDMESILYTFNHSGSIELSESSLATATGIEGCYYTNQCFPTANTGLSIELLTINYYDNYDALQGNTTLVIPDVVNGEDVTNATKGLSTVSKVKVLETGSNNNWITTVSAYDQKARPVWVASHNAYLETTDFVTSNLDFVGKVISTESIHKKVGQAAIIVTDSFSYDHAGRLLSQTQEIGDTDKELIVSNSYDALGQLSSKKVGGTVAASQNNSQGLQTIDYTYNIRGWLKSINNDDNTADNDLFNFSLSYNTPTSGTALFNGNISQTSWSTLNTDSSVKTYDYTYDALNRITGASGANTNNYNLNSVSYDKNGNILNLSRQGHTNSDATTFGIMDNLTYSYDQGNKLLKVADASTIDYGFKDGNTVGDDYDYDANGNMTEDKNKGITEIKYNHLNLPTEVQFGATNKIEYLYDAAGTKLQKTVIESGNPDVITSYAGNYIYENDALEFFSQPEGYVKPVIANEGEAISGFEYVYQYKDHLGNVRLSYTDVEGSLEVIEENNYYPFGLKHKGYNNTVNSNGNGVARKFEYAGKETEEELGLNTISYGWRDYDPAIARFNKIDRFAEKYLDLTPYHFTANNPIRFQEIAGDSLHVTSLLENKDAIDEFGQTVSDNLGGLYDTDIDDNGNVTISRNKNKGTLTKGQNAFLKVLNNVIGDKKTTSFTVIESGGDFSNEVPIGDNGGSPNAFLPGTHVIDLGDVNSFPTIGNGKSSSGGVLGHEIQEGFEMQVNNKSSFKSHARGIGVQNIIDGGKGRLGGASFNSSGSQLAIPHTSNSGTQSTIQVSIKKNDITTINNN